MDYEELVCRLRTTAQYGEICRKCPQCIDAADAIEALLAEREILHAHFVVNWIGDCHCSNCGKNILYKSNYCNWCGAKLDELEQREN